MKNFVTFPFCIILLSVFALNVSANVSPYITFSQKITGFDESGAQYPTVVINPANLEGMETHTFALGQAQKLVIETNIPDAENRGLDKFAETVRRCYQFIEKESGRSLKENILLYIIEFSAVPEYYSFQMSFAENEADWGEVRLVLVQKNDLLHGPSAPETIHELLYDTLPHELGHDMLNSITNLLHDIDSKPSYHTRWFIEGVCELLAKKFSHLETPSYWKNFLARRHINSVLDNPRIRDEIFQWAQINSNNPTLESDLYGAAMLVLIRWSRVIRITHILAQIQEHGQPLTGADLVNMMESIIGLSRDKILDQGHQLGLNLLPLAENRYPVLLGKY